MEVWRFDSQKNAKSFGVGRGGFNGRLEADLRSVEGAHEQLGHDRPPLLFIGRLILQREITGTVPDFNIFSGHFHGQVVKLTVKAVLGRIEADRVTHGSVRDRGAYRAFKVVVKVKGAAAGLVG